MKHSLKILSLALVGAGLVSCSSGASALNKDQARERALSISSAIANADLSGYHKLQASSNFAYNGTETCDIRYSEKMENGQAKGLFAYYKENHKGFSASSGVTNGGMLSMLVEMNVSEGTNIKRHFYSIFETTYKPEGAPTKPSTVKLYHEYATEAEFRARVLAVKNDVTALMKTTVFEQAKSYLTNFDGEKSAVPYAPADTKLTASASNANNLYIKATGTSYTEEAKFENNLPVSINATIGSNVFTVGCSVTDTSTPSLSAIYLDEYKRVDVFDDAHPSFELFEKYNAEHIAAIRNAYFG